MTRDLRKFARQTTFRLIVGGILLAIIVGDGLIYVFWGQGAAVMGVLCTLGGLAPVVLIILALWLVEWISKKVDSSD
jgi:hypothetical protein